MSRLTKNEKLFGIVVGIYGLVALAVLWIPHLNGPIPKGGTSPLLPWLIGSAAIVIGMVLIVLGLRMPSGLVMAAAAVLGPWSTYVIFAFPLVVWAGMVSFKRSARNQRNAAPLGFSKKRQARGVSIDANSQVRKPPSASNRYTPPKRTRKKVR